MKILVSYCLEKEVEIDEEDLENAVGFANSFSKGAYFNRIAQRECPQLARAIKEFDNGQIVGVYKCPIEDPETGEPYYEDGDDDDVIWEDEFFN